MSLLLLPFVLLLVSLHLMASLFFNAPAVAGIPSIVRVLAICLTIPPIAIALRALLTSLLLLPTQLNCSRPSYLFDHSTNCYCPSCPANVPATAANSAASNIVAAANIPVAAGVPAGAHVLRFNILAGNLTFLQMLAFLLLPKFLLQLASLQLIMS
jgi:hypothetical protein